MRALIVCVSVSHGNTRKVADVIGRELGARVVEPEQVRPEEVPGHDVVGFGSGVYYTRPHRRLLDLVDRLPDGGGTVVFTFATRGGPELPLLGPTRALDRALARRGYDVVGTFSCPGWDTWLPLRAVGGINRGHPDAGDLARARAFARSIAEATAARS